MPPKVLKPKSVIKKSIEEKPQDIVEPVPDKNNDRIVLNVGGKKVTRKKGLYVYIYTYSIHTLAMN